MLFDPQRSRLRRWTSLAALSAFAVSVAPLPAQPPPAPVVRRPGTRRPKPVAVPRSVQAAGRQAKKDTGGATRHGRLISLNFRDAPLDQVLSFYAELTGRTMITAPGLNATITLRGQTRLTEDEALMAIETVLAMHNIVLVPLGEKFFKVVQASAARQEGMPTGRQPPEEPFPETDHLISQIVDLKYMEISEVQPIIQGLMHGYGKIQPLERTNSLLITDTAANLQRILEILDYIDRPVETKVETRIYELRYAEAGKVAGKLRDLIQEAQAKEQKPRVVPVHPRTPPGVIRPRQRTRSTTPQVGAASEAAERGIIHGKVKIVPDERTNILIIISEPENFAFFDKIIAVLDRPVEPEIIVRVVSLEYADAEDVASILNEFIGAAKAEKKKTGVAAAEEGKATEKTRSEALREYVMRRAEETLRKTVGEEKARIGQLSPNTKILADKRTNSLLLMGRKADIAALKDVLAKLDVMLPQVLIEAVIMEVGLTDTIESGVQWLQRSMTVYNEEKRGPGGGIAVRQPVMSFGGSFGKGPFMDASKVTRESAGLSAGLTYYTTFFDLNIDAVIRMVERSSNARILQTPVILTTDNTEAKIIVGEDRPVVTSTTVTDAGNQTSQYEYRNIGINLTVTPHINPQNFVVMEINQQADDFLETVKIDENEVPVIIKRELEATVAVENRSTVVLGGLVSSDKRHGASKVPILGDIPLLGALFRATTHKTARRELMVLFTPYVLSTPEEVRAETMRLHKASHAHETDWYRGWSDSELAKLPPEEIKAQRLAERRRRREEARRRKLELRMRVNVPERSAGKSKSAQLQSQAGDMVTNAAAPAASGAVTNTADAEAPVGR